MNQLKKRTGRGSKEDFLEKNDMTLPADYIVERTRHKKSITRWKIFSLILLLGLFFTFGNFSAKNFSDAASGSLLSTSNKYIARILIKGVIYDDHYRIGRIQSLIEDDNVAAIIVGINSPGGSAVGSEMLYNKLLDAREKKPVVAVMESVAASGGYMTALGAEYIIAHHGTVTGSIGVIAQNVEASKLIENLGIKVESFRSSKLKANPNFFEKTNEEAREMMNSIVRSNNQYFASLLASSRKIPMNEAIALSDGRVYDGKQALEAGLVDQLGGYDDAVEWLQNNHDIDKKSQVVDIKLAPQKNLVDILLGDVQNKLVSLLDYTKSNLGLLMK